MATASHVLRVRRFYEELWNQGTLAAADELASRECVRHDPSGPVPPGPESFKQTASRLRTAFPDLHLSIDFVVAEGAMVVARWSRLRERHQGARGPERVVDEVRQYVPRLSQKLGVEQACLECALNLLPVRSYPATR
jgi:predicted SnoaL-like aldol condensation-catalyzing enzyme